MQPTAPSDPPLQTISVAGRSIAYTDRGNGPTLLALHGLPGSARDFRWFLPPLIPSLRVVCLDLPGFGGSAIQRPNARRIETRAALIVETASALGLDKYVVLGHSMGGPLAMHVAATDRRVIGLCLLASVGLRPHRPLRKMLASPWPARLLRIKPLQALLRAPLRRGFSRAGFPASVPDQALVQTVLLASALDFATINRTVASLAVPTFLAYARDDVLVEPMIVEELAQACPAGPRLVFEDGGHNLQKTRALELAQALVPWVKELS